MFALLVTKLVSRLITALVKLAEINMPLAKKTPNVLVKNLIPNLLTHVNPVGKSIRIMPANMTQLMENVVTFAKVMIIQLFPKVILPTERLVLIATEQANIKSKSILVTASKIAGLWVAIPALKPACPAHK